LNYFAITAKTWHFEEKHMTKTLHSHIYIFLVMDVLKTSIRAIVKDWSLVVMEILEKMEILVLNNLLIE
jgi:hypothetical protein